MRGHTEQPSSRNNTIIDKPRLFDVILCTGLGAGFFPWGPGTAGAAVATLIWCVVVCLVPSYDIVLLVTALLAVISTLISIRPINRLEKYWGEDASRIVVDEMAGVWITLLAVPESQQWYYIVAAFALFRLYDIIKPLGCRWLDNNIHGGWGVMLDDILAGVYGAITLYIITLIAA